MRIKSDKYPLLNDKGWIYQKYVIENLSTTSIAKLVGCKNENSINQALKRHSIPVRILDNPWQYYHDDPIIFDFDIINGSLLGDASLRKWNSSSKNANAYFSKRNKYLDHIELVAKSLYPNNFKEKIKSSICKCQGKKFNHFSIYTSSNQVFKEMFEKWYPKDNNFEKIVPQDLKINQKTLLHWFLDDGNSYYRNRRDCIQKTSQVSISMCCEGFKEEYVELLRDICTRDTSLPFVIGKCNFGYGTRLKIKQSASDDFFDYIGECPIDSMRYKWKYKKDWNQLKM